MASVLILGATSDLAKALAHEFAAHQFSVLLAARSLENMQPLVSDIQIRHQVPVSAFAFDARKFDSHAGFWKNLPEVPDVTISVFGYLGNQDTAMENWEEAQNILEANYVGAVSILNHVAQTYFERKSGTIIGISSVAGERGRQSNYIYGSAKAGFSAYLDGMRNRAFHHGVHVMTVKPGFMKTAMTEGMPLNPKLTALPEQAAKAIYKAFRKKKNTVFVLWMWKYIMCIIRNIPEFQFKKMKM